MADTPVNKLFSAIGGSPEEWRRGEYRGLILALNELTAEKGLFLTEANADDIINTRNRALSENERIETGVGAIAAVIECFSGSSFINQENYADTINELLDIFYYIKSEAKDKISDVDLLNFMFDCFEDKCYGSIDLMTGREVETLLRYIKSGRTEYALDSSDDYGTEPDLDSDDFDDLDGFDGTDDMDDLDGEYEDYDEYDEYDEYKEEYGEYGDDED